MTGGEFGAYLRETDTKLEVYEGNQTALRKEVYALREENEKLTARLDSLELTLAAFVEALALPDPEDKPLTKAETAEALKSLRTGGVDSWRGPG